MSEQRVKVLYIGGYSRSGSTVLLRLLGLLPGLESVGELWDIWQRSFLENQLCGCGTPFRSCDFWNEVATEAFGGLHAVDVEEMQQLRHNVYSNRALLPLLTPALRSAGYRKQLALYQETLAQLYQATQKVSGCDFIVDSSKVPTYALMLSENPAIDLYVLHLIRDSRATTYSWQRKKQRPEIHWKKAYMARYSSVRAALEWDVMNSLFERLSADKSRFRAVRYEDLAHAPFASLSEIATWLGLPAPDHGLFTGERAVEFGVDHTVSGNPNRFQKGKVEIRPDVAWKSEMAGTRKALVTALTWPLLRRYGYPLRARPDEQSGPGADRFQDGEQASPPVVETRLQLTHEERAPEPARDTLRAASPGRMRILLVTPRYLPYVGGTEIHTYEVARRLAEDGHDVSVLTTDPHGSLAPAEENDGVHLRRVPAWPRQRDYYFAPGIYREIRRGQWDLIHVQGFHTFVAPLAMLAAQRAQIPYIVTFHSGGHSSALRTAVRPLQRAALRPLLARARRLVGVSTWEKNFFQERLGLPEERFLLIPNGSYLPPAAAPEPASDGSTVILSVGRLERYKGHHRVLRALPEVLAERPDVRLRIIGSGPFEDSLRQMTADYGLAGHVEIRAVSGSRRAEMTSVLLGAKLVILLSDYESQGMAVMEALSLARPVLVADSTALRDLVDQGLARATPLGSTPQEVAQAILKQLNSPLIPADVNLPTWEQCYNGLARLYEQVVAESGRKMPSERVVSELAHNI